jgi:hypothetical protein
LLAAHRQKTIPIDNWNNHLKIADKIDAGYMVETTLDLKPAGE